MILLRLIAGPIFLVAMLIALILMGIYVGIGWIFTGNASVQASWPDWN